jgi:hypothetical protein
VAEVVLKSRYSASTCNSPTNGAPSSSLERHHVEHAEALVGASDDLLARVNHLRIGRLTEIVPVGRMEPVAENLSSDPGRGRLDDGISGDASATIDRKMI